MRFFQNLTKREFILLSTVGILIAVIVGMLVGRLADGWPDWNTLGAFGSILGGAVAAIAAPFAIYGFYQSQDVQRAEFRAYLRFQLTSITVLVGQPVSVVGKIYNYGRTPAKRYAGLFLPLIRDPDWSWENEWPVNVPGGRPNTVIHPNEDGEIANFSGAKKLTAHEISELRSGKKALFIRVIAFYKDVFGRECYSVYCGEAHGWANISAAVFRDSPFGNDAT